MDEQAELDLDDSWINELFQWADRYDVPDLQYAEPEVDDDGVLLRDGYCFGLPRSREALLKLEVLNLNGYIKSDIPDQIQYLSNLKELYLADGPDALWSLENEDKDHDCITEIPRWISNLENLEILDLSGNNISYIPSRLAMLPNLKELYLPYNRIEYITEDLHHLKELEILWLQCNATVLQKEAINSLSGLRELWIDGVEGSDYGPIKRCPEGLSWAKDDRDTIGVKNYEDTDFRQQQKNKPTETLGLIGL